MGGGVAKKKWLVFFNANRYHSLMQNHGSIPPPNNGPHSAPAPPETPAGSLERELDSRVLLDGQRTVLIRHHGAVYRLQATRQGKLILTK
jgi:hemin uptake protein HemP